MFQRFKNFRKLRKWYVVKLKLVDARLYFVSIFVGLLTGFEWLFPIITAYIISLTCEVSFLLPSGVVLAYSSFSFLLGGTDIRILAGDENAAYHRRRYSSNTCCHQRAHYL